MGWEKGIGTMLHHLGGEVTHVGIVLIIQVLEHIVTAPVSDKFDDFRINNGAEQGHGAGYAEGMGRHALVGEYEVRTA